LNPDLEGQGKDEKRAGKIQEEIGQVEKVLGKYESGVSCVGTSYNKSNARKKGKFNMAEHENQQDHFFMGLLIGGVLGALAGIFFAPKSGKELRSELKEKGSEVLKEGKEIYADAGTKAKEIIEEAKHQAEELKKEADRYLSDARKKAKEILARGEK
jgi:gas vesicle protein